MSAYFGGSRAAWAVCVGLEPFGNFTIPVTVPVWVGAWRRARKADNTSASMRLSHYSHHRFKGPDVRRGLFAGEALANIDCGFAVNHRSVLADCDRSRQIVFPQNLQYRLCSSGDHTFFGAADR